MKLNEAVAYRIRELWKERGITQYQLHLKTGVPQSTLSMNSYPSMKLRIIYEICNGLEIGFEEFFSSDVFKRENIEEC